MYFVSLPPEPRTILQSIEGSQYSRLWAFAISGAAEMPPKPRKPCSKQGCPKLTTERFCEGHAKQEQQRYDQQRGTAASRGYGVRWQKIRRNVLNDEPLCRRCAAEGIIKPADLIHHVDRDSTNNDRSNLEPLCSRHHEDEHKHERCG